MQRGICYTAQAMTDLPYNPDDPLALYPGEPENANLALQDYAALSIDERSLDALARHYRGAESAPSQRLRTLKTWSARYHWIDRTALLQNQRLAAERTQRDAVWLARRDQVREESWNLAQRLRQRAIELLDHPTVELVTTEITEVKDGKPVAITQTIIKPSRWAQRDIAGIAETFDKLARLAAGMDTAQVRIEGLTPQDLANLSDDDLAKLESDLRRKKG